MEVASADPDRGTKRQKLTNGTVKPRRNPGASRVFAPYRTVGLVSPTEVPFTAVPLGQTTFQITTSVGRSLQTYDLRRGLNLVFLTRPQTPELITASIAWKDFILAAWGGPEASSERGVWMFKRGKREAELPLPRRFEGNVKSLCIFGSWIVGVCETQLLVWKTGSFELYTTLQGISPVPFTKCISSLPTFLNKILVGRSDGSAELWNVSSGKLIYTMLPPTTEYGSITAIEPTPALSLVAIAYQKGPILIQDIRTDQTVLQLNSSSTVPVTSISFRTDGLGAGDDGRTAGVMATASTTTGDVTLWDLNQGGRKAGTLRAAHSHPTSNVPGGVSKVQFLPGQAILVSSGLDNSLRTWIFDQSPFSPVPRILHSRSGHGAPVTKLHFLPSGSDGADDVGKWLMSASQDRSLWGWSLRRDGQSTELSQGGVQKKAKKQGLLAAENREKLEELKCPPITAIACSLNRDGGIGAVPGKHAIWQNKTGKKVDAEVSSMTGWESVVTAHAGSDKARTWFWGRKRAGRWAFQTMDGGVVTAVAMSPCGTFALVGSDKGGIDMFNMQSGIHRQRFPARLTPMQAKQLQLDVVKHGLVEEEHKRKTFLRGQGKHNSAVVGLAVDGLNKTVVSAGADGKLKFWDFTTGLLSHQIDWSASTRITAMRFHRGSELAALACTDGCVRVVDISTSRLIRELWPSRPLVLSLQGTTISDFCISNDGHWVAACYGQAVLLWDLPTGHLVDAFRLRGECTSLAFSPTGEFLATATDTSVGVDIWTNRSLFMQLSTRHISAEELAGIVEGDAQAPTASGEGGEILVTADDADHEAEDEFLLLDAANTEDDIDDISSDLLSLSIVPRSRWQNLLHLDLIRQRNKPIEPPKKPEKAPFFLPSLQKDKPAASSKSTVTTSAVSEPAEDSRFMTFDADSARSQFSSLLREADAVSDFTDFLDHLKTLKPASADIEIRSLSVESNEMTAFVHALTWLMGERKDFELGQAWMAVFLRIHGDAVVADEGLRDAVAEWQQTLELEKKRIMRVSGYCGGVVGWLRAARV